MTDFECPGLPADWINGWLAAVGVTVLDRRVRLRWSTHGTPVAVLSAADVDPVEAIVESWPDADLLNDMPIARRWRQTNQPMKQNVPVDVFRKRAQIVRRHPHSWTLSSTLTDLWIDKEQVENAPFNPPVPKGLTLHQRLMTLHGRLERDFLGERVLDSLAGQAVREQVNGLGFDHSRIGSLADDTDPWVDPVVEFLAFFGLAILPMRGTGVYRRYRRSATVAGRAYDSVRQRGWRRTGSEKFRRFTWPAWTHSLDSPGVDALLDAWKPDNKRTWPLLGVHAGWRTVGLKAKGKADPTKAYASERIL